MYCSSMSKHNIATIVLRLFFLASRGRRTEKERKRELTAFFQEAKRWDLSKKGRSFSSAIWYELPPGVVLCLRYRMLTKLPKTSKTP